MQVEAHARELAFNVFNRHKEVRFLSVLLFLFPSLPPSLPPSGLPFFHPAKSLVSRCDRQTHT